MVFGVAGGLATYFDIDPVLVRVGFVIAALLNGLGVIAYLVLAIVTPKDTSLAAHPGDAGREKIKGSAEEAPEAGSRRGEGVGEEDRSRTLLLVGGLAALAGAVWLVGSVSVFSWLASAVGVAVVPIGLVVIGVLMIVAALRR